MSIISSLKQVLNGQNYTKYSTDEQVVGAWIDGKKIYLQVFNFTLSSVNYQYSLSGLNIDHVIKMDGFAYSSSADIDISLYSGTANYRYNPYYLGRDNKIVFENGSGTVGYSVFLILYFTKITD